MIVILSVTAVVSLLSLAVFCIVKNRRAATYVSPKVKLLPRLLLLSAVLVICDMMCGSGSFVRLLLDMVLTTSAMSFLLISLLPYEKIIMCVNMISYMFAVLSFFYLGCGAGVFPAMSDSIASAVTDLLCVFSVLFFLRLIWSRLKDVRYVVRSGNVWSFVCLCVDSFHILLIPVLLVFIHCLHQLFPGVSGIVAGLAVIMVLLEVMALSLRVSYDSVFVLMHDHERIIVESMKISHMDVSVSPEPKGEDQYRELYDRILQYFESSRPYLDGELTINDIVKVVYSNKVYISKAIFRFTGRNFRQFVNYHRIMYSIDSFRTRPELKVSELALMSGFNTVVSYTMAFRLFMDETPSEWCRKERARISKQKK